MKLKKSRFKIVFIMLIVLISSSVFRPMNVLAKDSDYIQAIKAYKKFLSNNKVYAGAIEVETKTCTFEVVDLNNDGIPELLLSQGGVLGSAATPEALYTYYKGKVTYVLTAGHSMYFGGFTSGNFIINGDTGFGETTFDYYKLIKGKLKKVASSYDNSAAVTSKIIYKYWISGKAVAKEKFDEYIEKETGSSSPESIDRSYGYEYNGLNIKKYLSTDTKMSVKSINLYVKESSQLYVYGEINKINWSSSNKNVVTVTKDGKIKGKSIGNATITAKTKKKLLKCQVKVKSNSELVNKMLGTWTANEDFPGWEVNMVFDKDTITHIYADGKVQEKYTITSLYKKGNKDIVIYYTIYNNYGSEKWKMIIKYNPQYDDGSTRKPYTQLFYYFYDGYIYSDTDLSYLTKKN